MAHFKCIECGNISNQPVSDTRTSDEGYITRTRKCRCGGWTHTVEVPVDILENYLNGVRAHHVRSVLRVAERSIKRAYDLINPPNSRNEA